MAVWDNLIRFGRPCHRSSVKGYATIDDLESETGGVDVTVEKLLAPVPTTGIPIICVGLNYWNHANEASLTSALVARLSIPATPPMWYKPAASLADLDTEVPFPVQAQKFFPDFEGELTIVLRKSMKNVAAADRSCGGQYTYAKGFDKFAPLGPRLVNPSHITPDARGSITTRVNGCTVQNSPLDFIFAVDQLLSFLSQTTTLPAGTAILTGTPAGHGDVVEVEVKPIGVLKTTIVFEK
ncbi:hypothetical protein B0T26DRAFT_811850 [Lasiosphaeria miniovina]|uniref:Fumarylacetoacetase-like C-terminal domain-containing protein n=1 Tax=Lasiosphaeria miniovina TaxID=1954250 RepID=A0AA40AWU7_9PEZI|nr:uncharacterized protein B0T26DRAFT_811850 [Lasiosphaeria miniovina]KAK0723435.1 hypothetical protein B0T26DRAFT_811850 [Lasiosphaeria miniovina]